MNDDQPPSVLYYATIEFEDGVVETPHYFVFDKLAEGVMTIKEHYRELKRDVARIVMKQLVFGESKVMPEDTHVLVPLTDNGIQDDFRDPVDQQMRVAEAEEHEPSETMVGVLPYEQEIDDLLCRAFFMGPFLKAADAQEYVEALEREPFDTSQPVDIMWLYRPTGEWKEIVVPGRDTRDEEDMMN